MAIAEVGGGTQRATVRAASVDSATVAFPGNVVSGNLLVAGGGLFWGSGTHTVALSDTLSTSYSTPFIGSAFVAIGEFLGYGLAASSGACTVTIDPASTGNYFAASIDEFSGVNATPLDVDGGETTGSSTTPADSLITLTDNALVLGVCDTLLGAGSWTAGTGYTLIDSEIDYGSYASYALEFQIVGTAGNQTADFTIGNSRSWSVYSAAFAAAGGAAAVTYPQLERFGSRGIQRGILTGVR